jgi:hypothetical protein
VVRLTVVRQPTTVLRLVEAGLDWRTVEGEVLALDARRSEYLGINRTGAVLWRALAGGVSRPGLIGLLVAHAAIGHASAERDVDVFLAQLRERGLLVEQPAAAAT